MANKGFLTHIDNAKREILTAKSVLKIKTLWSKADAMRQLGQATKDPELVNYAIEYKLRCERRLGELLGESAPHGGDHKSDQVRIPPSLKTLNISNDMSARTRRIASIPADEFEHG